MIPSIQDVYLMRVYFKGVSDDFKVRPVLLIDFDEELQLFTIVEITSVSPQMPPGYYIASRHSPRQMTQGFA